MPTAPIKYLGLFLTPEEFDELESLSHRDPPAHAKRAVLATWADDAEHA